MFPEALVARTSANEIQGATYDRATACHRRTGDIPVIAALRPRHVLIQHYDEEATRSSTNRVTAIGSP
nr:hypothetical protein GCM10020093_025020 [Planobispora longispora]